MATFICNNMYISTITGIWNCKSRCVFWVHELWNFRMCFKISLEIFEMVCLDMGHCKKYLWNQVNLSWQQLWNISMHKSLSNPNCSKALSKIPDWGSLQVPLILPNLVTFPFLQQNFLPLLRWCFRFFFWMRFLRTFSTFWAFFTQDFMLRASYSSSSYVNILLFWSSISILDVK